MVLIQFIGILKKKPQFCFYCIIHLDSVKEAFGVLESGDITVDPERKLASQLYWIFKHQYTFQEAQLWCLKRKIQNLRLQLYT